jgi:hypothetical protein
MPYRGRRASSESSVIGGASGGDLRAESPIRGELSSSHRSREREGRGELAPPHARQSASWGAALPENRGFHKEQQSPRCAENLSTGPISSYAYQCPIRRIMTSQDYQWSGKARARSADRLSLASLATIVHNAPMRICPMPVCAYAGMRPCKQALYAPMRLSAYAAMRLKPYADMPVCAYASKHRMRLRAYADMPVCAYAPKSLLIMRRNSKKNENHSQ